MRLQLQPQNPNGGGGENLPFQQGLMHQTSIFRTIELVIFFPPELKYT